MAELRGRTVAMMAKVIGLRRTTVDTLPAEVERHFTAGGRRLILTTVDGVRLKGQQPVAVQYSATPQQLGYLAGLVRAAVDRLGEQAADQYQAAYDEGYTWQRDHVK